MNQPKIGGSLPLHDHLGDAGATKSLAANKVLALEAGESVAKGRKQEEDGCGNESGCSVDEADELDGAHNSVSGSTHVVGRDSANEAVKLARGRADAEEQGNLDEKNQEGRCAV